jgi:hypothetical protein
MPIMLKDFGRLAQLLGKLCVDFHYIRRGIICQTIKIKFKEILRGLGGGEASGRREGK